MSLGGSRRLSPERMAPLLAGLALVAAGCGTGPNERAETVQYQLGLVAVGSDTTPDRVRFYDCFVAGFFQVPNPVPASGTIQFPVTISRSLTEQRGSHLESTSADSSFSDVALTYTGLGSDSLTFTLGAGPYVATLVGGTSRLNGQSEYAGPWTCNAELPLARDSRLNAYGYDPNLELPGSWRVTEIVPID